MCSLAFLAKVIAGNAVPSKVHPYDVKALPANYLEVLTCCIETKNHY